MRVQAELAAVRTDLEAARRQEHIRQASASRAEKEVVAPIDDSATWRRRYEHLAGMLADMTKENKGKVRMVTYFSLLGTPGASLQRTIWRGAGISWTIDRKNVSVPEEKFVGEQGYQ